MTNFRTTPKIPSAKVLNLQDTFKTIFLYHPLFHCPEFTTHSWVSAMSFPISSWFKNCINEHNLERTSHKNRARGKFYLYSQQLRQFISPNFIHDYLKFYRFPVMHNKQKRIAWWFNWVEISEAATRRRNSQENTFARVSFLIELKLLLEKRLWSWCLEGSNLPNKTWLSPYNLKTSPLTSLLIQFP